MTEERTTSLRPSRASSNRSQWLLLVHVLPPRLSNLRVKTWRRLRRLGAVAVKNSVYVLPHSDESREDFEWIKTEIEAMGGEASVFAAESIDALSDEEVKAAFRRARQVDYARLEREASSLRRTSRLKRGAGHTDIAKRQERLATQLAELDAIAFFPPDNRAAAAAAVAAGGRRGTKRMTPRENRHRTPVGFHRRIWITRPKPGIDRMASAWLIRRFIDPFARFAFGDEPPVGTQAISFDMYGVEFGHSVHGCTFETLAARFAIDVPAVSRIARIVHDVDLKEARYNAPEAPTLRLLVDGLRRMPFDDARLLQQGMAVFEAFYLAFSAGSPTLARRK